MATGADTQQAGSAAAGTCGFTWSWASFCETRESETPSVALVASRSDSANPAAACRPAPRHWLAHLDYDLEFRRRPSFAVNSFGFEGRWSFIAAQSFKLCVPVIRPSVSVMVHAALVCASSVCAYESLSSGYSSVLVAAVSNAVFLHQLSGDDSFRAAASRVASGVCSLTSAALCPRRARFPSLGAREVGPLLFWVLIFARFSLGDAVCLSCAGNDPN